MRMMMVSRQAMVRSGSIRALAFACGAAAIALAAMLDRLSTVVLSAHMVQHLLLTVIAPLLLVCSRPGIFVRRALPLRWRSKRSNQFMHLLAQVGQFVRRPIIAWLLLCAPFAFWHVPALYQWTITSEPIRALALTSFFIGATGSWAALLSRSRTARNHCGVRVLLVMASAMTISLPGALMTLAPRVLYLGLPDPYPFCGLTALEDQQLAGLIMWIPMDAILFSTAGWLFLEWLRDDERRVNMLTSRPAVLSLPLAFVLLFVGCSGVSAEPQKSVNDGDAQRGAVLVRQYGCGTCHTIPGIADARGLVGPPLTMMGRRLYIVGLLRNSPENMMIWLQNPQQIVPGNVMPNMGINRADARDLTAYLYTLK
jgi:putative membrane protein